MRAPRLETDFAALRRQEFGRLDAAGHAYLDDTGAGVYPASLVTQHAAMLGGWILGNPHAESPASLASTAMIDGARRRLLQFLDADAADYVVCFTANTTAAVALVGAAYPFGTDEPLVLTADNHNSVNGIREHARRAGAAVHVLPLDAELRLDAAEARLGSVRSIAGRGGLFAFPGQSNFSGVKHPLSLVRVAQGLGYRVLLDAAALLPTTRVSLRRVPADFVALSFYKMFGYPTGIGALVARRDALATLRRPSFSGGTVEFVSVQGDMHAMRAGAQGFEDGTANFLGIPAIPAGLDFLESLGLDDVEQHVKALAMQLIDALGALRHSGGSPLVHVYGPLDDRDRGGTVAFNVLDRSGDTIPFGRVEERARDACLSVRGGCFCNPGASEAAFAFPADLSARCLASTVASGWSVERFAECMAGHPVGAVRASFGPSSNVEDMWRLVEVVRSFGEGQRDV
ncbi:MAG: aminotransferase class V-fold PLP-dependent enzyme [bacterium]